MNAFDALNRDLGFFLPLLNQGGQMGLAPAQFPARAPVPRSGGKGVMA
jgi:hypothetical protein